MESEKVKIVTLDKVEDGILQIENEVFKVEKDLTRKTVSSSRAILIQTIALILAVVGLVIANERRLTTIEVQNATEAKIRAEADASLLKAIERLQVQTENVSANQIRVVTILDMIEKRDTRFIKLPK